MASRNFHFSFNTHILEGISLAIPVVKEKLFTSLYRSLGKYANSVIPIYHHYFCIAIGVNRMICKSDLVSFPGCVNNKIIVQVEEETAHVFVIDFASTIRLILRDDLSAVLRDELVLLHWLLYEDAPASNIRRSQQEVLLGPSLDAAVLAGDVLAVPVVGGAAGQAEVGVTLAHGQVAGTLLGVALGLTAAPGEAVLTLRAALAEFLAEVLCGNTGAGAVAGLAGVIARLVVVHVVR